MTKKFDVVIGNPPYQEQAVGTATHKMPIYHRFMDTAYEVGRKAVLITPARFLFNAGYTPKKWNRKMLDDPHLKVQYYVPDSNALFPGTDIKGGIVVTYRDIDSSGEPIGTFAKHAELNSVLLKVESVPDSSIPLGETFGRNYTYAKMMHEDHPEAVNLLAKGHENDIGTHAFERLAFLYHEEIPNDGFEYVQMLGLIKNKRVYRWVRSEYIEGPTNHDSYKVVFPKSNGSGNFGETISSPQVLGPYIACTRSFITAGDFENRNEAEACLKYVKSKFARALLGVLKITQHNSPKVWKRVPVQDFTNNSDIDWSMSIPEIDQRLYAKYVLDDSEIAFIEKNVKPME